MVAILIDDKGWEREIEIDEATKTIEYFLIDKPPLTFELHDSRDGKPVYRQNNKTDV